MAVRQSQRPHWEVGDGRARYPRSAHDPGEGWAGHIARPERGRQPQLPETAALAATPTSQSLRLTMSCQHAPLQFQTVCGAAPRNIDNQHKSIWRIGRDDGRVKFRSAQRARRANASWSASSSASSMSTASAQSAREPELPLVPGYMSKLLGRCVGGQHQCAFAPDRPTIRTGVSAGGAEVSQAGVAADRSARSAGRGDPSHRRLPVQTRLRPPLQRTSRQPPTNHRGRPTPGEGRADDAKAVMRHRVVAAVGWPKSAASAALRHRRIANPRPPPPRRRAATAWRPSWKDERLRPPPR